MLFDYRFGDLDRSHWELNRSLIIIAWEYVSV
jgi:hypothetical protein